MLVRAAMTIAAGVVLLGTFQLAGSAALTVAWTQSNPAGVPGWNGYTSLHYDPVSRRVLAYLITGSSTSIYSTDMFAYDTAGTAWTRLGGTRTPSGSCNDGSASDVQPWPADRHPVQQMAVDTRRNRLWLVNGVCGGQVRDDMWFYSLNQNPTQNRWTRVTLSTVPSIKISGALVYSPDDDVLLLSGANSVSNAHETWVFCPSTGSLSSSQSGAGCSSPNAWTQLSPSSQPTTNTSFPVTRYDAARRKVVHFGSLGAVREVWEYDIPTRTWTNRRPSRLPAETDVCCPEQPIAYISSGQLAGKFVYHQTAHTTDRSVAKDYVYDPVANTFTEIASSGTGPQKLVYLTWDAGRNTIVAWSYVDGVAADVWHGVIEGDLPQAQPPAAPQSFHIIR